MKSLILVLSIGVGVAIAQVAGATASSKKKTVVAKASDGKVVQKTKPAEDLKTDVKFDDSVLHGQYQVPEEALAKVENEKGLTDLIGVRKHFKDRLSTASEQE